MTVRVAVASRNAGLNAAFDLVNGASPGKVLIYSGAQPATADTTETGTLLVTFTLNNPAFSAAASGIKDLIVSPALTATAAATGIAGWVRVTDSAGAKVFDGSVATSGADFTINSTSITSGQTVNLTAGSITDPA